MAAPQKKAAPQKADEKKAISGVYLQNKEGRVFIATAQLLKQMQKGKFGLVRITKATYDEAISNGGMTTPLPDIEDDEE